MLQKRGIKQDRITDYNLDVNATAIKTEKQTAKMTYKSLFGYMSIGGSFAENGLVVRDEFGESNVASAGRNLAFIKYWVR